MNFLDKLDFLMGKYKLNKHSLSQAADIPYTTIDGFYKKGYDGIRLSTVKKIAEYFNTTIDYLTNDEITDPNYDRAVDKSPIGNDEIALMLKYRDLSDYDKETIRLILDRMEKRGDQT